MPVRLLTLAAALVLIAGLAPTSDGRPLPGAPHCPVFPQSNAWNQRVDRLPVQANSDAIVRAVGADETMHADFGSGLYEGAPIGIPFVTVGKAQPRVPVSFDYADESDRGPYPIPPNVPIEGGRGSDGDRHVIVVDRRRCRLYELFSAYPQDAGARWSAGSGAIWNLRSNRLRPRGWTSADAAGLPILPGLARYDEVSGAASTTRCVSPWSEPAGRTSSPPATSPPISPIRIFRRWASASASRPATTSPASPGRPAWC